MKKAHIYKITNVHTDDIYIGSTIQKIQARLDSNLTKAMQRMVKKAFFTIV